MHRNIRYRATGGVDYVFDFEWVPAARTWRAYIVAQPLYGARPTGAHETHRLNDGRPYVCWDRPLATAIDARNVAAAWAEATQHYIRTGRFVLPPDRPSVRDRTRIGNPARPVRPEHPAHVARPPARVPHTPLPAPPAQPVAPRQSAWRRLFS